MTINLITQEEYQELILIQHNHPILTYQNKSYDNFDHSKMTSQDVIAFERVEEILRKAIVGFKEFQNFKHDTINKVLKIRLQYDYTADWDNQKLPFTGVGYLEVQELFNGFKSKENEYTS
jgi:hypothetical protein